MALCAIRVPRHADPVMVEVPAKPVPDPGPLPVATISHAAPGEVLLTCTCRRLREAVDVDDTEIRAFLFAEHLAAHPGHDHLLIDDARTGAWSSFSPGGCAQPETSLVLTKAGTR
jgi:hypothetical protein